MALCMGQFFGDLRLIFKVLIGISLCQKRNVFTVKDCTYNVKTTVQVNVTYYFYAYIIMHTVNHSAFKYVYWSI